MRFTQEDAILTHLRTGAEISPLEALDKFGCFRLAGVIFNLREAGYEIETQVRVAHRDGRKKHFAAYKLISCPANDGQRNFTF
jgi:hypothetical protein